MNNSETNNRALEIPVEGLETPYGYLYPPLSQGKQILVLIAVFFAGPAIGHITGMIAGDLSETAQTFLYVPYVLIFFMGYSIWLARLKAIAFDVIGKSLLKTLLLFVFKKQKPQSINDLIPDREKLLEMAVRAQKAGASFTPIGWLVGLIAGTGSMLITTQLGSVKFSIMVLISCAAWGHCLGMFGRRGWLPIMEEN